jgi:hypothetical protein
MEVIVQVDASQAVRTLAALRGAVAARAGANKVAAFSCANLIRRHLIDRNVRSQRSNYWSQAAEAVTPEHSGESAAVVIRHPGIRWHLGGGTIAAKPGKAMAIPLRDEVHGVWPSEYFQDTPGAAFVWRRKGKAFLATRDGKVLKILYLLVKAVSKEPDPSTLPAPAEISAAAAASIRDLVRLALARRAPPATA